jgi:dihydrofolate reductase
LPGCASRPGGNIWLVGGAQTVREFMLRDLIDEYVISIHPVVLGGGISLFPAPLDTHWLKLERAESFASGLVQITYSARR